ncbi:putative serine/threonine protein kinase (Kcc4) [Penicillium brasilianum]|uniref:non-specific serine/threonine protein kinase n=1 Tax=Penicillium brasilianum TaxID=104259 RepID=A0A1S9RBV4_PENBI|nr:putative serine/threonine protein kinase (Kcc4) [Penicillium brasilianum]
MDYAMSDQSDSHRRRQPLTDASSRINHAKAANTETPRVRVEHRDHLKTPDRMSVGTSSTPRDNKENQRLSVATDFQPESARNSVISAASILSNKGKRKTHVGPWQLGRTLGKGATGRVRLAKHALTGQTAAIKIVSKKSAAMVQSESIAAMDRTASTFTGASNARQMPCGIEREVVIMKLIEHPNVISLYDVWENRGELYLVLEYVEGGELFDYVSNNGPLPEEEAVRVFRQIIAGLGYCHRFNICHRDLKPENILLDGNHNVKIADFGMAALQPAGHWLNTSCGSPHYAAPEIIYGRKYRGDRADMWSCGIILYALLTGYLPFDGGDLANTLRLVKKGDYMIPPELSDEAADLIQQILQKRPEDRIPMHEIWLHPLLTKYEKLHNAMADYYIGPPPPLSIKDCGDPVTSRQDVDFDILRNLQTLWHNVNPDTLIDRMMSLEPTHERMFYNALVKFRDEQLENYQGQPLEYSASDYHHISRPGDRVRRGRSSSKRRSQVSAVKELHRRMSAAKEPKSSASIESYDPYRSPKVRTPAKEVQFAHITIHKASEVAEQGQVTPAVKPPPSIVEEEEPEDTHDVTPSPFTVLQKRKHKPNSMKSFQSSKVLHSSSRYLGLSTRSTSYRRNVSFHHVRNRSQGSTKPKRRRTGTNQHSDLKRSPSAASLKMIADDLVVLDIPSSPPLPAQPTVVRPSSAKARNLVRERKVHQSDMIWTEDARKVSNELGKICEEAFNGSSLTTMRVSSSATGYETPGTPVSVSSPQQRTVLPVTDTVAVPKEAMNEPGRSYSIQELTETRRKLVEHSKGCSDNIPAYLSGVIGHLDRLIEEDPGHGQPRRKMEESTSTLVDPFSGGTEDTSLPMINEEFASPVRAPSEYSPMPKLQTKARASAATSRANDAKTTIRMVPHSSLRSIEEVKPLMIRKKVQISDSDVVNSDSAEASRNFSQSSRQSRPLGGLEPIEEVPVSPRRTTDNKKWSWFKHRSQVPDTPPSLPVMDTKPIISEKGSMIVNPPQDLSQPDSPMPIMCPDEQRVPTRKLSMERFGGGFFKKLMPKKSNKSLSSHKTDMEKPSSKDIRNSKMLCNVLPDPESSVDSVNDINSPRNKRLSVANQNWFARVFQIKPACRVIALNTSKLKGRKEVYKMLREWKEYGMENVHMDKSNSVVHGRVSEVNFLRLREVEFVAEFYTVLEHGRQANLSLVRFKQERGAASSFNKVVDTVYMMLKSRGLVVEDPVRAKKMARVLDIVPSSP